MIKSKKQMYLVIGAFALVMLLGGITYAFFNYTRTGTANTIRVGRIAFNTSQASGQDGAINLSNAFPITRTLAATDNTNAGEVVITITGDTSYSSGVEYLVTATDVTNTVNSKIVPISIIATASNGLGTSDDSYFTNRGGNSSIYKVLANETISNNDQLLVGYIAPDNNQTGVNGTITIRAYLDSDLVVISDTYNNGNTPTDNLGTPASFGEGKTVLTTSEWNGLRTNGVSFKIKVEANEGTWVEEVLSVNVLNNFYPNASFPPGESSIYTNASKVKEIQFKKMSSSTIDSRYNNSTIKGDVTYNNEGTVKAWFEQIENDEDNYIMYVASDGLTYLNSAGGLFSPFSNVENFVFENMSMERLTSTSGLFNGLNKLERLNLGNMGGSNLTTVGFMFSGCTSLTTIDMSNFNFGQVNSLSDIFSSSSGVITPNIEMINLSGANMSNVTSLKNAFRSLTNLRSVDLSNTGSNQMSNLGTMFMGCINLEEINMHNFNFGNITSLQQDNWSIFYNLSNLTTVDLSEANMSNVVAMAELFSYCTHLENINFNGIQTGILNIIPGMFQGCTNLVEVDLSDFIVSSDAVTERMFNGCNSLERIYVSDSWNISNSTYSSKMFANCTSLVGQSPNTTYAFDENDAVDKTYAVIATDNSKGYLTDISLKPTT